MPRYYFDLLDGRTEYIDDLGDELKGDREARECARAMLIEDLYKPIADIDTERVVTIRDEKSVRFLAKLTIRVDARL